MSDNLILALQDGVLTATLNRPAAHNAIDDTIVAALDAAIARAEHDAAVRVLSLRANGTTFCGGVDLRRASTAAGLGRDEGNEDTVRLTGVMVRLARLPKPSVAIVQGPVYGGGIGLIVACDIVLAVPEARFALTQVRHGLVPGFVAPFLAHAIGTRRAKRYLLTGERFGAAEAHALGLVHEVVAPETIDARAAAIIADLGRGGPESLAGTKRVLDLYGPRGLDDGAVRALADEVAEHRRSAEATEGMAAFREKRPPAWCAGRE
jgi:methylglutaconyl-CoA hydratase